MREPVLFIHIIAAMVYFGMPFSFGRWYRMAESSANQEIIEATLDRFRKFSYYMYAAAAVLIATGLWLTSYAGLWQLPGQGWVHGSLTLMFLSILSMAFFLSPAISKKAPHANTKKRLIIFSGIHHTLVTALIFLMVFKPF